MVFFIFYRHILLDMNIYKKIVKPILFMQDPEKVHDRFTTVGKFFGKFFYTKKNY